MKVYNRQFVARTATTDRVMRTTDREYVHTTVSLNKEHNERDNEMVQLTKMILKQTARHTAVAVTLVTRPVVPVCRHLTAEWLPRLSGAQSPSRLISSGV